MRKPSLLVIILSLFVNSLSALDYKTVIEKALGVSFEITANDSKTNTIYYSCTYRNCEIEYFVKFYANSSIDGDFFYCSRDMKYLYNALLKKGTYTTTYGKEEIPYAFSNETQITKIGDKIIVDYLVFSMYEVEDIRLSRFVIIFDSESSTIIRITPLGDFNVYKEALIDGGIIIKRNHNPDLKYYIWDYENMAMEKLEAALRKGSCGISAIDDWSTSAPTSTSPSG